MCVCLCVGGGDNDVFKDPLIQGEVEGPEEKESSRSTFSFLFSLCVQSTVCSE